jgi:pyruvate,water dikinase
MDSAAESTNRLSVDLAQVSRSDHQRVGVKAANLASLLQAGFPVPDGRILTTDAFVRSTQVGPAANSRGSTSNAGLELREALKRVVDELGQAPLAVRSSGTAEDLADASFAGQYETVLRVSGLDALEAAVRRCWASARSERVAAYRGSHRLGATGMAVLVQRMVDAHAAGVAFTANPVTGRRGEVVINAVRGLGDRLVSGEVSPDQWLVAGTEARCDSSTEGAIGAEEARAIAELARRVEDHFGQPQDIEWALADGGQLHLLQARPISSLPEAPADPIPIEVQIPPGFWLYDASHNPRPGYQIDLLVFPLIRRSSQRWAAEFGYLFDGLEFTEIGMWPYQRMVPLGGREGPMPPRWLMWLLVRTLPLLRHRVRQAVEAVRSDKAGSFVERWYEVWQPELNGAIFRHLEVDLTGFSDSELARHVHSSRDLVERGIQVHMLLFGAVSMVLRELATTCADLLDWDLARTIELVSGTSFKSTEPARRLNDLTRTAAGRPAIRALLEHPDPATVQRLRTVDPDFAASFSAYLDRYGHRALGYTLGEPTLAEMPWVLLGFIAGQLERDYEPQTAARFAGERRLAAAAAARARLAGWPRDLDRFERALERAERAYPVREDNEFFTMSAPLAVMRYAVLEVGRRLAERAVIAAAPDVMHLDLEQALSALADGGDHRGLVGRREGERAWAELHPGPPFYGKPPDGPPRLDFLSAAARPPMEAILWGNDAIMAMGAPGGGDRGDSSTLRGIPASAGEYTGPVRVVRNESQFGRIRPGDVLVCPITSPVWSVLFPSIGALVTDTGGVLSHPAIIAREYGIPAIVATGTATSRLADGDVVTVNGSTGTVEIETAHPAGKPIVQ